jgi:hypothetical protein
MIFLSFIVTLTLPIFFLIRFPAVLHYLSGGSKSDDQRRSGQDRFEQKTL